MGWLFCYVKIKCKVLEVAFSQNKLEYVARMYFLFFFYSVMLWEDEPSVANGRWWTMSVTLAKI